MLTAQKLHHPRRSEGHDSVSLIHSPRATRAKSHEPGTGPGTAPTGPMQRPSSSPSSLKPYIGRDDSGESSCAEKWFDKSNNYASRNSTSYVDHSPPFFLQNSSSGATPNHGKPGQNRHPASPGPDSRPQLMGLSHLEADNGSTAEYRGVIDDLTIENKKLKRKLKTYEKYQDSHLKDQKLFEVRVHGLPTNKKRELEEMLRQFALGLQGQPGTDMASNMYNTFMPSLGRETTAASSAHSNLVGDSAYASASASGQGSLAQSQSNEKKRPISLAAKKSQHQTIHTYLHDIPEGLFPKQPIAMTEKAKKKLVVLKLEQVFAGKGAGLGNQQHQQQQEVSQIAARMDRTDIENSGRKAPLEGIREARIMRIASTAPDKSVSGTDAAKTKQTKLISPAKQSKGQAEQRPTRPLDLDPYRAQVPADNIDYIRHLGFSPPGAEAMEPHEEGHGWIYLNLMGNMAQLHTLNVTPEFVGKAIQEKSHKLELSEDGRKVRWKGGKSITKTSSDGGTTPSVDASGSGPMLLAVDRGSPRKRLRISQQGNMSAQHVAKYDLIERQDNKLAYTPLFQHRGSDDDSGVSSSEDEEATESAFPFQNVGDSSGMTSSCVKTNSTKKKRKRENGPIIFYNNAKFCTDLSGDAKTEEAMMYNAFLYHSIVQQPVGIGGYGSESPIREIKGPLASTVEWLKPMDLDDHPSVSGQELGFPEQSPMGPELPKDAKAYQFEVSGLGGVCPADNFAINVQSLHAPVDKVSAPQGDHVMPAHFPSKIAVLLKDEQNTTGRKSRAAFHKRVIVAKHEYLSPSKLPDASCFMAAGDTSPECDDEDSDLTNDMSLSTGSPNAPAPAAAPQRIEMDYDSVDQSSDDSDDDSDFSDDGSLDLLATARQLDPEAVLAKEREYDANMADRLAEIIPAGSSAATAGGGSGFASPASNVDHAAWTSARKVYMDKREREKQDARDRSAARR